MDSEEKKDLATDLAIVNSIVLGNGSIWRVKIGSIERQPSGETKLSIDQEAILWPKWHEQVGEIHKFRSVFLKYVPSLGRYLNLCFRSAVAENGFSSKLEGCPRFAEKLERNKKAKKFSKSILAEYAVTTLTLQS